MAYVTIRFSILLAAVGVVFYWLTGHAHPTALIPAWFGLALLALGILARSESEKQRKVVMHIAVTVALLGFVFPLARVLKGWAATGFALGMAVREELLMAVVCLVLTVLYVQSFIAIRKARK